VLISLALLPTTGILNLALNWLPTLVTDRGHPASLGASAALAFNLAAIVGSVFLGVFSNSGGWRWLLPLALLTLAATLGGLAFTDAPTAIMVLSGTAGFLVVGSQFVMYALSPQLYPEHVRATGAGGVVSVGRIGSIIGPILAGQLRGAGATPGAVFLALIPAAVVAAIALIGLGRAARDA
jgi:AAHS family 3-hydroxyphenylpropionic acid transporter